MARENELPLPKLDALLLGAHRSVGADEGATCATGATCEIDATTVASPVGAASVAGDGIPTLTDERLFAATGVRIAFTSRAGGVSEGQYASLNCALHVEDDEDGVMCNRRIVLQALGAPKAHLIVPSQVHGTHVVCVRGAASAGFETDVEGLVSAAQRQASEGADAIVVQSQGVAALLNFADCLPLIIVSPDGSFAVAHAGWRGAVARIASKAVCVLADASSYESSQFNAYIGPHIREECFEVGADVADAFAREFGRDVLADERHVSLARAVASDLVAAGLQPNRIADAFICTKCHPEQYFSYRATNGACGRHSAVAIRL